MTDTASAGIRVSDPGTNWAGNHRYSAARVLHPSSADELAEAVATARAPRVLGTRHTFNGLPDTDGDLIALDRMPAAVEIDAGRRTVRVTGAPRYGDVARDLEARGWALHNLASLPHIGLAGSVATATHGSGDANGTLSSAVSAVELLTASGETVRLARGDRDFGGAVVSLGALGVVTAVELDLVPTYEVSQRAYRGLPWEVVLEQLDELTGAAYSVSLFTDWGEGGVRQAWLKATDPSDVERDELFGAPASSEPLHMLPGVSAVNTTPQLAEPGPWNERLPHFKLDFLPSSGEEIQSEYLVERRHARGAIEALRALGGVLAPVLQGGEIRTMAADDQWLSSAYREHPAPLVAGRLADPTSREGLDAGTVGFHFTWRLDSEGVLGVLPAVEDALAPFDARPHWGKVFVDRERRIPGLYPRMADFRALAARLDPERRFVNAFLAEHVLG